MPERFSAAAALTLDSSQKETLLCVLAHMIPASAQFGIPGADDPIIFADILRSIGRDGEAVQKSLRSIDALAHGRLTTLSPALQRGLLAQFRCDEPDLARVLESIAARSYYRDNRVLRSIGMEARAPYPGGYQVSQGDWSLLDPVLKRGRMYRETN